MGLLEDVRKKKDAYDPQLRDCEIIKIDEEPHSYNFHYITALLWKGKSYNLHTISTYPSSLSDCSNRIVRDIFWSMAEGHSGPSCWNESTAPNQGTSPVAVHKHICLLCGSPGDDLVVKFYCTNSGCKNYHL